MNPPADRDPVPPADPADTGGFSEEPVLRCTNIHKYLGRAEARVHVLRGVGLDLHRGRMYSIVGPSGCGKSTLLYLLGLLDRQDEGKIWIGGTDMGRSSDAARTAVRNSSIGFVFQFHFLLAEFTALENLMLPMRKLEKLSEDAMRERAQALLDEVGLGDKSHRMANELSGGEQQRVAVARALANEPAVIFADEPTGNLDVRNSTMVFDLLRNLCHEHGQAVLMVTHNQNLANLCDEVLCMQDGEFVDPTIA
ncbi:MAG: ABC transporter ATP-binding protein [Puniceicoccaceae bacterium]